MPFQSRGRFFWLASLLALVTGCGSLPVRTLSDEYETLFIRVANNSTLEYGAEERLTESLVQEFERDGRLRQIPNGQNADLVLEVNIVDYELAPVALDNDNRTAGRNLKVEVMAGARSPKTGAWAMPMQTFSNSGNFYLQNTPGPRREDDVYRRIAEGIISRLFEGWG